MSRDVALKKLAKARRYEAAAKRLQEEAIAELLAIAAAPSNDGAPVPVASSTTITVSDTDVARARARLRKRGFGV